MVCVTAGESGRVVPEGSHPGPAAGRRPRGRGRRSQSSGGRLGYRCADSKVAGSNPKQP